MNPTCSTRSKSFPRRDVQGKGKRAAIAGSCNLFSKGKLQKFFMAGDARRQRGCIPPHCGRNFGMRCAGEKETVAKPSLTVWIERMLLCLPLLRTASSRKPKKAGDSTVKMLRILKAVFKNTKQLTEEQEEYLRKVISQLEEGGLPKQTI